MECVNLSVGLVTTETDRASGFRKSWTSNRLLCRGARLGEDLSPGKDDIKRSPDCDGVVYIPLDNRIGWRMKLVQEVKAAGFDVDANKVVWI